MTSEPVPSTAVAPSEAVPEAPSRTDVENPGPSATDRASEPSEGGDKIKLKIASQAGTEVYFALRRNMPFSRMMSVYCPTQGIEPSTLRFVYDGQRIREDQTPQDLEMEEDDTIDAFSMQIGGI